MEQETPASYEDFISALECKLASASLRIEEALLALPAHVSQDPAACADLCLYICHLRADAEGWCLALRAAHRADTAMDLIGPADRLGQSLLSSFDMVLEAAGDWYDHRLYQAAIDGPLSWWTPLIEPFDLGNHKPRESLSALLRASNDPMPE